MKPNTTLLRPDTTIPSSRFKEPPNDNALTHDYAIEILFDLTPGKFDVPLDWTAEQADRFVTILGHLEEAIWALYGEAIIERDREKRLIEQHLENDDDTNLSPDDDIPF